MNGHKMLALAVPAKNCTNCMHSSFVSGSFCDKLFADIPHAVAGGCGIDRAYWEPGLFRRIQDAMCISPKGLAAADEFDRRGK